MKKQLIAEGKLDKHGKANESTPEAWKAGYVEYMKVAGAKEGGAAAGSPMVTEVAEDVEAKEKREKKEKKEKKKREAEAGAGEDAEPKKKKKKNDTDDT